jgi:hypothetical protein
LATSTGLDSLLLLLLVSKGLPAPVPREKTLQKVDTNPVENGRWDNNPVEV